MRTAAVLSANISAPLEPNPDLSASSDVTLSQHEFKINVKLVLIQMAANVVRQKSQLRVQARITVAAQQLAIVGVRRAP